MVTPDDRLADNSIQFPRLLAEIMGVGLTAQQLDDLCETMGLDESQLIELFDRADSAWQKQKDSVR